jgi:hypothetical protein
MTARKNKKWTVAGAACAAFGVHTAGAETIIEPRVGFDITWIDNVSLLPDSAEQTDTLLGQVRPGIRIFHEAQRSQAYLDYQLQAMHFEDSPNSSDQVFHQASLGLQYEAIPDWFYLDVGGVHRQTVVDPTERINIGNAFQVGNIADDTEAHITPILQHTFRLVELEASYTEGFVDYSEADDVEVTGLNANDSTNRNASAALRSADPEATLSWEASYRHDEVEYDLTENFEYDQANLLLGFRVGPAFQLLGRGGSESDPRESLSQGGLEASSWQAGFAYRQGERMELRLLAGERFFGSTLDAFWQYTGRVVTLRTSYVETPTTQTQNRVLRSTTAPTGFPAQINDEFARLTSDVYLMRRLEGQVGLRGRLTEIYLNVHSERREYFTTLNIEDESRGARLLAVRRLGPQMRLEAQAGFTDADLREGDDYKEHNYSLALMRDIGTRTGVALTANRFERSGSTNPYRATWLGISLNMSFGKPGRSTSGQGLIRREGPARRDLPTVPGYQ